MKIVAKSGHDKIALVYIAEFDDGKCLEFVEALQPPLDRNQKWVLLVSTMFGCPVGCAMCDAGGFYQGKATTEHMMEQIDFLVSKRFPDRSIPCIQFKIQFARMGEPALNPAVLEVLRELPRRYKAPGLMPSISTIAPAGSNAFFEELLHIKRSLYSDGWFQFQISLHSTDEAVRNRLAPIKKMSFDELADYGSRFYEIGDRKITLNFALADDSPVDPSALLEYFSPEIFLVKFTPLNPTYRAYEQGLKSYVDASRRDDEYEAVRAMRRAGYDVILSIGNVEENFIGSNCGQFLRSHLMAKQRLENGYQYAVVKLKGRFRAVGQHGPGDSALKKIACGEIVAIGEEYQKKPEWAGWIWCETPTAGCWTPIQIIEKLGDRRGVCLEDYDAMELEVKENDIIEGDRELNGWIWGRNLSTNCEGWAPMEILVDADDGA